MPLILSFENWLLGNDKALEYCTFKVKNNVKNIKSNENSFSILIIVIIEESKKKINKYISFSSQINFYIDMCILHNKRSNSMMYHKLVIVNHKETKNYKWSTTTYVVHFIQHREISISCIFKKDSSYLFFFF